MCKFYEAFRGFKLKSEWQSYKWQAFCVMCICEHPNMFVLCMWMCVCVSVVCVCMNRCACVNYKGCSAHPQCCGRLNTQSWHTQVSGDLPLCWIKESWACVTLSSHDTNATVLANTMLLSHLLPFLCLFFLSLFTSTPHIE